jgi:hypothetical protein
MEKLIFDALMSGLTAGLTSRLPDATKTAIDLAYQRFKDALLQKYGKTHSGLTHALKIVEKKPDSSDLQEVLQGEIQAVKPQQDTELIKMAQALLLLLPKQGATEAPIQMIVTGNDNIQISNSSNVSINERNA